jgi:hypothetical protein
MTVFEIARQVLDFVIRDPRYPKLHLGGSIAKVFRDSEGVDPTPAPDEGDCPPVLGGSEPERCRCNDRCQGSSSVMTLGFRVVSINLHFLSGVVSVRTADVGACDRQFNRS